MKLMLTIGAILMTAFSAKAALNCSQGNYQIIVDGENAAYYYASVKVADVNNVQATSDATGVTYATDMGFQLNVKGDQGAFQGIWPNPAAMYTATNPLLLECK